MITRKRIALALTAALLAACSSDDSPTYDGPPLSSFDVPLAAAGGSGVTGTAGIDDYGSTSTVRIELVGMIPNSSHAGHIHQGSCAQQGAIVRGLPVVTAAADGRGSATSVDVPNTFLTGAFYIQYHVAADPPGDPLACGDLPD